MVTLSFSPKLLRQNEKLVVIPQKEYELLRGKKMLPAWLKASLRDVAEGRLSGPFASTSALMAHLKQ